MASLISKFYLLPEVTRDDPASVTFYSFHSQTLWIVLSPFIKLVTQILAHKNKFLSPLRPSEKFLIEISHLILQT